MYNIEDIKKYIVFLKTQCGLSVTLHPIMPEPLIIQSELITFNIHDNPYCIYIKSFPEAHKYCIECQHKVKEKCKRGSFTGSCFAGVSEYVYPISNGREVVGFISVSGYKNENCTTYFEKLNKKYSISKESLAESYKSLKPEMPEKSKVDTLIIPLCNMLELSYIRIENDGAQSSDRIDGVIWYVKKHHAEPITLDDVCEHFAYSRSFVSHAFKRSTGKSFREYLTDFRLEDAKALLLYSDLSITEISYSVGFCDSSYFSNVFKSKVGISPLEFRKTSGKNRSLITK